MSIDLHVHPEIDGVTWEAFRAEYQPYGIALDGFVKDGPKFDPSWPCANFNHHEGVDRLATRATCAQVLIAIRQGLFSTFSAAGDKPHAHLYVNDCDEDVCTSTFALMNSFLVAHTMNPLFNRLVGMEEVMDATAGAYPFPSDLPALRELNWVFQPYRVFRAAGGLGARDPVAFKSIIEDVHGRIRAHITGHGDEIDLDSRYRVVSKEPTYTLVEEIGLNAKTGMFFDGIHAYVTVRKRAEGCWDYVIGRMSKFVDFDVPTHIKNLSEYDNAWGGGDTIGGSHRVMGSRLCPDDMVRILNEAA